MEDEAEVVEDDSPPRDLMAELMSQLAELDPTAMVLNFVTVVEWIEADGSPSFSTIGSQMPPWQAQGLMQYALDRMKDENTVHTFMAHVVEDDDEE